MFSYLSEICTLPQKISKHKLCKLAVQISTVFLHASVGRELETTALKGVRTVLFL